MPRLLSRIRAARARAAALLALAGCAILLGACTLPPPVDRTASHALDATQARATPLGQGVGELADTHPGLSGFHVLGDAQDAFAARMLLARAATRTLDVQYYIWRNDMTGTLLLQALHAAAERGVRVRLLLDDNGISGLDDALAALDAHPNAEVRLFNPFPTRSFKALGYLTDFSRLNRRMHNKSFTVDNQATIIGGRNIGDEYFGATDGVLFADLDVLAVGPVVGDVSAEFDAYWASESAWPAGPLLPAPGAQTLRALAER
ncbi:phospholipase D-like domain-containing protein, partial [Bordetella pertussis]